MPHVPVYFQRETSMSPAVSSRQSSSQREESEKTRDQSERDKPAKPLLRLHLDDLSHATTKAFTDAIDVSTLLSDAVDTVLKYLYDYPPQDQPGQTASSTQTPPWPSIRSITLVLRPMEGVAYTTSLNIDTDHKEIHLSLDYLTKIHDSESQSLNIPQLHSSALSMASSDIRAPKKDKHNSRLKKEIIGVVTHEMVHVWQAYADGSAPVGLTEGVADWVRLRAGLAPPHWKRQGSKQGRNWDDGYETTGWFLEWLECDRVGRGTVRRINEKLRTGGKYVEAEFWKTVCGADIALLWQEYTEWLDG